MAVAKDPFITTRRLAEVLHSRGIRSQSDKPLSHEYLCKIVRKVHEEAIRDLDHSGIKTRIVRTQTRFNLAFQKLSEIAYEESNPATQVVALRTLMEMDLKLLAAEMNVGLYKSDSVKTENEIRNRPLDPEIKARIITAMRNYGLVLPQKTA